MFGVAAEFQNVALSDSHVLLELPGRVGAAGGFHTSQRCREPCDGSFEIHVRATATQQIQNVLAYRLLDLPCSGHLGTAAYHTPSGILPIAGMRISQATLRLRLIPWSGTTRQDSRSPGPACSATRRSNPESMACAAPADGYISATASTFARHYSSI